MPQNTEIEEVPDLEELTNLESALIAVGITLAGGAVAGIISRSTGNDLTIPLSVGYAGGMSFLLFCKSDLKETFDAMKITTMNYASFMAGYLGTSYI